MAGVTIYEVQGTAEAQSPIKAHKAIGSTERIKSTLPVSALYVGVIVIPFDVEPLILLIK